MFSVPNNLTNSGRYTTTLDRSRLSIPNVDCQNLGAREGLAAFEPRANLAFDLGGFGFGVGDNVEVTITLHATVSVADECDVASELAVVFVLDNVRFYPDID